MLALLSAAHVPHNLSGRILRPAARPPARVRWLRGSASTAAAAPLLQRVLDLASSGDLDSTVTAMDALTAEHLAITATGLEAGGPVGYHHIYSDHDLSIGIFVLPAGSAIPLHDHPDMTVLSKMLFGRMQVTSFDRPLPSASPPPAAGAFASLFASKQHLRCPAPVCRTVAAPCAPLRLDPVRGNIHEFVALEHTAIFDVLTPPYDDRAGRSCHYYETNAPVEEAADEVELREVGWPPNLRVVNRPYRGPAVVAPR